MWKTSLKFLQDFEIFKISKLCKKNAFGENLKSWARKTVWNFWGLRALEN